jgi:hypothetical protein
MEQIITFTTNQYHLLCYFQYFSLFYIDITLKMQHKKYNKHVYLFKNMDIKEDNVDKGSGYATTVAISDLNTIAIYLILCQCGCCNLHLSFLLL